jgi:hypothetical protein
LIRTDDNYAHPSGFIFYFGNLNAHPRILAHPLDLLSRGGKDIQMLSFKREVMGTTYG